MADETPKARVARYDVGSLKRPTMTAEGWLRCDGYMTRTGIFTYRNMDGTVRRELRLPDEVFSKDSLDTFRMVPLTDDHPPVPLNSDNTKQYAAGSVGEDVRADGDFLRASMLVTDGALIRKMLAGKSELSCGYTCEVEDSPGEWNGQHYDSIQRNIRGNHLAVVLEGRAGPNVRVKMDTSDAVMVTSQIQEPTMVKLNFDGIDYEVSEQAAEAIAKADAKRASEVSGLKTDLEKATARADAAEAELKKSEEALKLAMDPNKIDVAVKARVDLETAARKVLGAEAKFDGKDDAAIKVEVVAKAYPEFKPEGKSADYIQARFDLAVEKAGTPRPVDVLRTVKADVAPVNSEDAYSKYISHMQNLWKEPVKG